MVKIMNGAQTVTIDPREIVSFYIQRTDYADRKSRRYELFGVHIDDTSTKLQTRGTHKDMEQETIAELMSVAVNIKIATVKVSRYVNHGL